MFNENVLQSSNQISAFDIRLCHLFAPFKSAQNKPTSVILYPKYYLHIAKNVDIIPTMITKLDNIDIKILNLLQQDASLSVDVLADRVSLSRNACWRRVKRLENDDILQKRVAIIDPEAVGLALQAFVVIKTNDHSAEWLKAFRQAVRDMPEVIAAQRMTGDLDYVLRIRVADVPAYDRFYQRLIEKVQIADVSASFVMEDVKETTALPI